MSKIRCKYCDTDTNHSKDHYYIRHSNTDEFLLMFFKTPFIFKKDGELLIGERFHYLINPPYAPAEHGSYKEGFINDWIFFQGDKAAEIIQKFKLPLNTPFHIADYSLIFPYINKINRELRLKYTCYEDRVSSIITDMLIDLGRQYELISMTTHPAFHAINSTRNYMLNHLEEKFSIKELAERANYSESRFCILYHRFFSTSPIDELLGARIEKATSLLRYSNLSVTEITTMCGFSSIHYFSRKFKEKTGVSPTDYIKLEAIE